ncbi:hypothetical protein [Streptomyces sp. NPDC006879]|uniref:hypothetical protein n=1 Tax=Streptomyces sp. NPDC006879 TaxID=3364767 RepID=UPI0036BC8183
MAGDHGASGAFVWRARPRPPWWRRDGIIATALLPPLFVIFLYLWELGAFLLLLAAVYAATSGHPRWCRDVRTVREIRVEPGPPAQLVLRQVYGRISVHPTEAVTELQPYVVGVCRGPYVADQRTLLLRLGRRTYRTRDSRNPAFEVRQLEEALRRACPNMVVREPEDRRVWVLDLGI